MKGFIKFELEGIPTLALCTLEVNGKISPVHFSKGIKVRNGKRIPGFHVTENIAEAKAIISTKAFQKGLIYIDKKLSDPKVVKEAFAKEDTTPKTDAALVEQNTQLKATIAEHEATIKELTEERDDLSVRITALTAPLVSNPTPGPKEDNGEKPAENQEQGDGATVYSKAVETLKGLDIDNLSNFPQAKALAARLNIESKSTLETYKDAFRALKKSLESA